MCSSWRFFSFCKELKRSSSKDWIDIFADRKVEINAVSSEFIHVLSHQKLHAQFWKVKTNDINLRNYQLIAKEELENYPVSRLTEKYFETLALI